MRNKLLFILLTIIIFSFPSICFSESKTFVGEYCKVYLGDMKNKGELDEEREVIRVLSIKNGLLKVVEPIGFVKDISEECVSYIKGRYLEKVKVISHTEDGRKICERLKITLDPEVINEYSKRTGTRCFSYVSDKEFRDKTFAAWVEDVEEVIKNEKGKINIGLIIEIELSNIGYGGKTKKELEDEVEEDFYKTINQDLIDKVTVVDRRHINNVIEEQKFSLSGITDTNTIKIGKILNLDIIVIRILYDEYRATTKVLKVQTGEILFFKTYQGW